MAETKDRILVVDHNAEERAMLVEAALEPSGYDVRAVSSGAEGLQALRASPPDVLILDLHIEGLSGQDVLAAMNAQGYDLPVILLANQGSEREALRAFRLGAMDYLLRPVREAELIQATERALKEVRLRREREALLREVQRSADQMQRYLHDLRTLMSIGKSITSLHSLDNVFGAVVRATVEVTGAEASGFFLREDSDGSLVLRAGYHLPGNLKERIGQPVEDDLASLVMSSKQTYIASGEGLRRFSPAHASATAVIYAPLVVNDAAVGLLWVANEKKPFQQHMKDLMTALADYAAIAVVNARLITTMQARTRQLEQIAREGVPQRPAQPDQRLEELANQLRDPLIDVLNTMNMFRQGEMGQLRQSHRAAVDVLHRRLGDALDIIDSITRPGASETEPRDEG